MTLPPCHVLWQLHRTGDRLSMQVYQRSADVFLGLPYNLASYALLLCLIALETGLRPGRLRHVLGDAHLYRSHLEQGRVLAGRVPRGLPRLRVEPQGSLFRYRAEHIEVLDYDPHPALTGEVAV